MNLILLNMSLAAMSLLLSNNKYATSLPILKVFGHTGHTTGQWLPYLITSLSETLLGVAVYVSALTPPPPPHTHTHTHTHTQTTLSKALS